MPMNTSADATEAERSCVFGVHRDDRSDYTGEKRIAEYAFNDHEGGGGFHERVQLRWLAERLRG